MKFSALEVGINFITANVHMGFYLLLIDVNFCSNHEQLDDKALPSPPHAIATIKNMEDYNAFDMLKELKTMFQQQAYQELSKTIKAFHACKSVGIPQAPERYDLYVDVEKHESRDHGEPTNSKAALSYHESGKWLDVMNAEMQIMKDNDLPPDGRTVGSKWLFKK
ncbi:hypothetical protein Tco_0052644 [Tanacetum coccineum]